VTICTHGRGHWFGEAKNGTVHLSDLGQDALAFWSEIPQHFPHAALDLHVVMPNHVHRLVILTEDAPGVGAERVGRGEPGPDRMAEISPRAGSLPVILRSYKAMVTRAARARGLTWFRWQPRYHDHRVRTAADLARIRRYIDSNPANWSRDEYYDG
jgi:REP element-mobilizing transposase RayT